ncbi:hypothetical protein ILYODFUR_015073 [Ilyodon furcidens]|uniref:Uncharacterized protein n=1 Tax=Ilyodon furcidens TaxID=33524 RepID=A0ABV0U5W8_9TELE
MESMVKKGKSMEEKAAREKSTRTAKVKCHEADCSEPPNEDRDSAILHELRGLRKEHAEAVGDNKRALARLETRIKDLMDRTASLEQKVAHMEERVGNTEDKITRMERTAIFLLRDNTGGVDCDISASGNYQTFREMQQLGVEDEAQQYTNSCHS